MEDRMFIIYGAGNKGRAGKALGKTQNFPLSHIHQQKTAGKGKHRLHRICQALFNSRTHNQPVHHNLYIMLNIVFQLNFFRKFV